MRPVNLMFEAFGESDACPIIILHGFLASARNWRTVANRLAVNHRVYVLDQRNHGASPHAENMDYPAMAADVLHFMDNMGLGTAHLLGHSMGGKVAMWFAMHYPERVGKLIVVDIAPVNYSHSFDPVLHALRKLPLENLANRKQAELHLAGVIPDLGFRQFLLQNLMLRDGVYFWRINLDIIHGNAHYVVGFPQTSLTSYDAPALFVVGEHSDYVDHIAVIDKFPNAKICEIPGTGHWLYVEAPEIFCNLVLSWIEEMTISQ